MSEIPPQNWIVILLFSTLIIYLPFVFLFYQNRHIQPIAGRTPFFILILDLGLYFLSINELSISIFPEAYPLAVRGFLGFFPYLLSFTVYNFRLLSLLFCYKITANVVKQRDHRAWEKNWYLKHRWMVSGVAFSRFLMIQNISYLIFYIVMYSIDPTCWTAFGSSKFYLAEQSIFWDIVVGNEGLWVLSIIFFGWKLRRSKGDAFKIKTEIVATSYTAGSSLLVYGLMFAMGFPRAFASIAVLVTVHLVLALGTVWPYYLSLREKTNRPTRSVGSEARAIENIRLIDLLRSPEGFKLFLDYMKTEFNSEHLLFWEQVELLKQSDDLDIIKEKVTSIFMTYCCPNSPCLINIPFDVREALFQSIERLEEQRELMENKDELRKLFDLAQGNVYELMNSDPFPRFQKSPVFQSRFAQISPQVMEIETSGIGTTHPESPSPASGGSDGSGGSGIGVSGESPRPTEIEMEAI